MKYLVERLESKVQLNGRNISFDRLYTSLSLEMWLYEKSKTSIGTLQINRKGIPTDLKEVRNREQLTTALGRRWTTYNNVVRGENINGEKMY